MERKSMLLTAALSALAFSGNALAQGADGQPAPEPAKGECHGVNACKGQGDCGGKGNSCAGKNECKGQGWKKMTEAECKTAGGTFQAEGAH